MVKKGFHVSKEFLRPDLEINPTHQLRQLRTSKSAPFFFGSANRTARCEDDGSVDLEVPGPVTAKLKDCTEWRERHSERMLWDGT